MMKLKLSRIKSKTYHDYEGRVYDLTVENDHSFLGKNGVSLHNSICKTRIMTGFGVATLASIFDVNQEKMRGYHTASIIADGGIRYPGDVVKSLAAGADAVICGSIFAGTKESPGETIHHPDGSAWKVYRGMASAEVQEEKRGGMKPGTCAEGTSTLTKYKGSLDRVLANFVGGLRSGLTYANAGNIRELQENAVFVKITSSGVSESHSHGTKK